MSISNLSQDKSTGQKIGDYSRYQREKRGWTLNQLAELTSLTPSFLFRLENGEYQTVKFDVIQKLASGLQMTVRSLLWKCQLIESEDASDLPSLEYYLKEKFQFSVEAIDDTKLFLDFIHKKYSHQIKENKQTHKVYWKKKC